MSKKIVIIGGTASGSIAATRLRRLDENAQIILFEKNPNISVGTCGMPYYLGNVIENRDLLFITNGVNINFQYNIDIRTENEITKIEPNIKTVTAFDKKNNTIYKEKYDKLILATGSVPIIPEIDGIDSKNVFTFWTLKDTDNLQKYIKDKYPKRAIILGGGYLGLEIAENLKNIGIDVNIIENTPQILSNLDYEISAIIKNNIMGNGVGVITNTGIDRIENEGKTAILKDGTKINTDMIIITAGVKANSKIAKDAGININEDGSIIVDKFLQTNIKDIYAIGDAIESLDIPTNSKVTRPLANIADLQGRIVASNVLEENKEAFEGSYSTSILKIFDYTVASVGRNEKSLKNEAMELSKDYSVVIIHPLNHTAYYPEATKLTIKLLFSLKDYTILGCQILGIDGVQPRINTIATAMYFNSTVYDLAKIKLPYSPVYSTPRDPINTAGNVACNIIENLTQIVTYEQYVKDKEKYTLLDVREIPEIMASKIKGAINIPISTLRENIGKLDKNKTYLIMCSIGLRAYIAERMLKQNGFKSVYNLSGGYAIFRNLQDEKDGLSALTSGLNEDREIKKTNYEFNYTHDTTVQAIKPNSEIPENITLLNVCGLNCPGPIMQVAKRVDSLYYGDYLQVRATDPAFVADIKGWCQTTSNTLISIKKEEKTYVAVLRKGYYKQDETGQATVAALPVKKQKTMVIFDGDLDKAIAAFVIANGAAAMGDKVTMFFTFWGLNIIKKSEYVETNKSFLGKILGFFMPKGSKKLPLSKMNFFGIGSILMKKMMKRNGILSLEQLIKEAKENNVKLLACQMSMDALEIKKEELIDGVEIGGVATMLNDSNNSNMNLFI